MIHKYWLDTSAAALGATDTECARVWVTLHIDGADDVTVVLSLHDGTLADRSLLCASAERELAAWIAEQLEDYANYLDDMALMHADMSESELRYRRWFGRGAI